MTETATRRYGRHGRRRTGSDPGENFDRRLIAPLVAGSLLNPINSSMIAVALIPIGVALGESPARTVWLVSALYLATAVGQPVVGRLVDLYGPRPLYLVGTALVGVAGTLGALAPSLGVLVAARVLLGFGTCAGYPAAMFLIRSESRRTGQDSPNGVLTILAVASQTIAVVGPTFGGLLIGLGGWRTVFTVNIPLSLVCLVLGWRRLPRNLAPEREARDRRTSRVDLAGMVLFATTLTSLLLFLMSPQVGHLYLLALTATAATGLVVRELRVVEPFIDPRSFVGNVPVLATFGRNLLTYVVSYAFIYGFTQWLEGGRGLTASQAGLALLPMFLTAIVVSAVTGRHSAVRGKLLVGSAAQIVACVLLLQVHTGSSIWLLVVVGLVVGVPQGLNSLANQNALYHQSDPARMGSSAGLLRTFMYLGAMIAASANAAAFRHGVTTSGLHHLALFMLCAAVPLLLATLLDRSLRRVGRPQATARP